MKSDKPRRGRPRAHSISVHSLKQISAVVNRFGLNGDIFTYRDLTDSLSKKAGRTIGLGTVYRMANGHDPKRRDLRRALGITKSRPRRLVWQRVGLWLTGMVVYLLSTSPETPHSR